MAGAVAKTNCLDQPAWRRASALTASRSRCLGSLATGLTGASSPADPHPRSRRRVHRRIPDRAARRARCSLRHARRGRARRAPAQNRARARCDRTAPSATGCCARPAPSSRCIDVASARRARSASRCARSRSRAMAWRCACALASLEAFSRISSPAKRSRRRRSSDRARHASCVRRTPSAAAWRG